MSRILTERSVDKEVSFHSAVLDWPGHTKQIRKLTILMQKSFLSSMFGMKFMLDHSLSLHNFVKTICTDFVIEMDHDILIEARWLLWLTLKSNNKQKMRLHLLLTSNHTWWWLQLLLRVGQRRMSTVIQFFLRNLIFRFLTNMYQASTYIHTNFLWRLRSRTPL